MVSCLKPLEALREVGPEASHWAHSLSCLLLLEPLPSVTVYPPDPDLQRMLTFSALVMLWLPSPVSESSYPAWAQGFLGSAGFFRANYCWVATALTRQIQLHRYSRLLLSPRDSILWSSPPGQARAPLGGASEGSN